MLKSELNIGRRMCCWRRLFDCIFEGFADVVDRALDLISGPLVSLSRHQLCHYFASQHEKRCKRTFGQNGGPGAQTTAGRSICKTLFYLYFFHAKYCTQNGCPVPYCVNIKRKLRQQLLKRLEEVQILNRSSPLKTGKSEQ
jgi:hypothetical protein